MPGAHIKVSAGAAAQASRARPGRPVTAAGLASAAGPDRSSIPPIEALLSPAGVVGRGRPVRAPRGLGRARLYYADLGSGQPGLRPLARHKHGWSRLLDDTALARTVAIAEAAERYAGREHDVPVWRCAVTELRGPVIDVDRLPRCSDREYADPGCPLVPFDPAAAIGWTQGTDLHTFEKTWVPAVMACYGTPPRSPAERFWYQISTGYAVHTDPAEAVVRAIMELIERDVIAVLWLQRLPLPRVDNRLLSASSKYLLDWSDRHFIETLLFDATSDLGVPAAYCLQLAEYDQWAAQSVGCATGRTITEAAEKALLDTITVRSICYTDEPLIEDYRKFDSVVEGARFMARAERAGAFSFLTDAAVRHQDPPTPIPAGSAAALACLLEALGRAGMQVVVVDRTTDELRRVGLTAVAALIPDLQPMTLHPLARYLGHPRLYSAPATMGYRSLPEEETNPWPQPFS